MVLRFWTALYLVLLLLLGGGAGCAHQKKPLPDKLVGKNEQFAQTEKTAARPGQHLGQQPGQHLSQHLGQFPSNGIIAPVAAAISAANTSAKKQFPVQTASFSAPRNFPQTSQIRQVAANLPIQHPVNAMPDYQGMPEYPPNPGTQKKPRFETITSLGKAFADEFRPLGDRHWSPNHARQATAEFQGEMVVIHNIRNTDYRSATDYTTQFFDAVYNLSEIESMDVIEVPFAGLPSVAHLEVSFGFADGRHLGVSVEARYENGESFDTLGGFCNQFELIYVIADERDMIRLCTDINKNNVYMYRLKLTPEEVRTVFVDVLERANKLSREPEFYHSVSNNCTTNIIKHINHARAKAIPFEYRTLFSGYLDHLLYDLKLLETTAPTFEEARSASLINPLASEYGDTEFFSAGIRQNYF